jgi:hypothetical protein
VSPDRSLLNAGHAVRAALILLVRRAIQIARRCGLKKAIAALTRRAGRDHASHLG